MSLINVFLFSQREKSLARRVGLIGLGTILVAGFLGLCPHVQAQPAQPTEGTPVSTNYVGLRTDRSYQPLPITVDGATVTPPAVHVVPLDDDLRERYHINPFYKKTLTSVGVVIVGSDRVSDWAFLEAAYTLDHQLHGSPGWVRDALTTNKVRLAIIAVVEYTMDLPENNRRQRSITEAAFQDRRSRGLGGLPDCSCAEENLLNLRGDPYGGDGSANAGENITIHEFSHTVASAIGRVQGRDGEFWTALKKAFKDANAPGGRLAVFNEGHQNKVYASNNEQEYWAEGAQAWFDNANPRNSGGIHERDDVKKKDPELAACLTEIYGDGPWRYHKTTAKNADGTPIRPPEELAHLEGLEALRGEFPVFNFRNSPRAIALAKENAAQAAAAASTNSATMPATTNAAAPANSGQR